MPDWLRPRASATFELARASPKPDAHDNRHPATPPHAPRGHARRPAARCSSASAARSPQACLAARRVGRGRPGRGPHRPRAGVSVGGVELAGLDRAAAAERLDGRAAIPLHRARRSSSSARARQVVAFARPRAPLRDRGHGRRRFRRRARRQPARRRRSAGCAAWQHATALPVIVHAYDPMPSTAVAAEIARRISHPPVEAAVTRDGTTYVVAREPGRRRPSTPPTSPQRSVRRRHRRSRPTSVSSLTAASVPPIVDTADAEAAAAAARGDDRGLALDDSRRREDEEPLGSDGRDDRRVAQLRPRRPRRVTSLRHRRGGGRRRRRRRLSSRGRPRPGRTRRSPSPPAAGSAA